MRDGGDSAEGFAAEREEFERMIDDLHATVRLIAADLPTVHGLAGFPTPERAVGGWARTEIRAERISLVYGDFTGLGPLAIIHTTQGSAEFLAGGLHYGEGTLDPAHALSPEDELPVLRRFEHFKAVPDLVFLVAGQEIRFHCRRSGTAWYAWADQPAGGPGLVVEAAGIEPTDVKLIEVHDLDPFLDGHRMLLRNAAGMGLG
jgi:hypothetical protein